MHRAILITALLLAFAPRLGTVQTPASGGKGYGAGFVSCGEWTKQKDAFAVHQLNVQWVLGFVSGATWVASADMKRAVKETDAAGIEQYMTDYCAKHPLQQIVEGATALMRELGQ
jgi:hypothetical protein